MTASPQVFRLGNSTILVHDDTFEDGYTNDFVASPKDVPLSTDSAIYEFTGGLNTGVIISRKIKDDER